MTERATRSLGWLHLTDLHIGQPREGGRLANIEREFLADLENSLRHAKQPIHLLFFTGDIAFRGAPAEYVRATALLGRLCHRIHTLNRELGDTAMPTLVPVPGNHDLARPRVEDTTTISLAFAGRDPGSAPLWQNLDAARELVDRCFTGYRGWLQHPLPFPTNLVHGLVPGDVRATVARQGIAVGVVGLNSAYLHFDDLAEGKLHLDLSQLTRLVSANLDAWVRAHHFCVLMTHHPPHWLSPLGRATLNQEIKPDALFDLHLFGHTHAGSHRIDPGTTGVRHMIEGRSLFGAEEEGFPRLHGYGIGRFQLHGRGKAPTRRVEYWARHGWPSEHGYRFDTGGSHAGDWRLQIDFPGRRLPASQDTATRTLPARLGRLDHESRTLWRDVKKPIDLQRHLHTLTRDTRRPSTQPTRWLFLSASVPDTTRTVERVVAEKDYILGSRREEILRFVVHLAHVVTSQRPDLGILFGGHPSITAALAPVVLESPSKRPWLVLVQDASYWPDLIEEVGVLAADSRVVPCLVHTEGLARDPKLELMRTTMLKPSRLSACVFVGGMSGVMDEFRLAGKLRPKVPRFCVGLGGGAAATLLVKEETAAAALGATSSSKGRPLVSNASSLWHSPKSAVEAILAALPNPRRSPPR